MKCIWNMFKKEDVVLKALSDIKVYNHKFEKSPFKDWSMTQATRKGAIGEDVAWVMLEDLGHQVSSRVSKEHDLIVDGKKVELKTGFIKEDSDCFVFYGYDPTEDPHYWVHQFVFPEEIFLVKMDRNSMANIFLGKSRKNTMYTVTLEDMLAAGGETIGYYNGEVQ